MSITSVSTNTTTTASAAPLKTGTLAIREESGRWRDVNARYDPSSRILTYSSNQVIIEVCKDLLSKPNAPVNTINMQDAIIRIDVRSTRRFSWAVTVGTSEFIFTAANETEKASWCRILSGDEMIMNTQTLRVIAY